MTDLRKLAALRREATPGSWTVRRDSFRTNGFWTTHVVGPSSGYPDAKMWGARAKTDAAYIAAAGSLTAEEWDALADVIEALERAAANNHDEGAHDPPTFRECSDQFCAHARRALDRLQETTP